ncbi:MAG: hypothetical protein HQK89_00635 [Nitrospirae bacterium]|nr:hypothetical protein [Nitrospirota bacterium]
MVKTILASVAVLLLAFAVVGSVSQVGMSEDMLSFSPVHTEDYVNLALPAGPALEATGGDNIPSYTPMFMLSFSPVYTGPALQTGSISVAGINEAMSSYAAEIELPFSPKNADDNDALIGTNCHC